jgi:5-methylcytosine-specific restriction protein A
VDHIVPHKGDMRLFWDPRNHQGLCERCHNSKTAREDGGFGHKQAPAASRPMWPFDEDDEE